ncbi:hypothetical protein [Aestuariivirga sp.]|uniref:hypothetical protein n=1 Tax=Aestuariivirga sp. TaxID=2650926 RepID=UPI00391CECA4
MFATLEIILLIPAMIRVDGLGGAGGLLGAVFFAQTADTSEVQGGDDFLLVYGLLAGLILGIVLLPAIASWWTRR